MGNPLADLGLGGEDSKLSIDMTVSITKSLEDSVVCACSAITKFSNNTAQMIQSIGYSIAVYFILSGTAKLIEATRETDMKGEK